MVSSIQALGAALRASEIQNAYATRVAVMQRDAIELQGQLALELLSAALPPGQGENLDVRV